MSLIKTDNPGFYKDDESGMIINLDERPYKKIINERQRIREQKKYEEKLKCLENDISEIKKMLIEISNNKGGYETGC